MGDNSEGTTMTKTAPNSAITVGILLIIVGVLSRVLTGTNSITALIPAFFGLPIAVLGVMALSPRRQRGSLIAISILSLLGVVGTYSVFIDLLAALQGTVMSASTIARSLMLLLCLILLIVCGATVMRGQRT